MKQIYIHGLGQTPGSWNPVIQQLHVDEYSICPDLAGLVQGSDVTYQNLYTAFAAMCNAMNEPLCLCGLSLGGVLALNYAAEYPEKAASLVLIASQYKMPKTLLRFQNMLFRFMPESMFEQMGFGKSAFLQLCNTMMELDFSDALHRISCPVLVICGEKDTANKNASVKLTEIIPRAELHILNDIGHEVNTEAPEKLADVLCAFYRRIK